MSIGKSVRRFIRRREGLSKLYAGLAYAAGRYNGEALDRLIRGFAPGRTGSDLEKLKKDVIYCYKRYRIGLNEYFLFRLESKTEEERQAFIGWVERKEIGRRLRAGQDTWKIHIDKYRTSCVYQKWFKRETVEITGEESYPTFEAFAARHPRFVSKPRDGSKGDGVAIHDKEGDGRDTRELFEELLRGKPLIIEELVVQDPRMAAFHPSSVNTMRVMTWYDGGEMTILYALVRMGRGGSVIDNASAGGVIAAVDRESGTIMTPGYTETGMEKFAAHPDTGVQIEGAQVPEWSALCRTLKEVAEVLPDQKMTGWDLALTKDGWVLIEVNHNAAFVGIQMCTEKGIRPVIEGATGFSLMYG